MQLELTEQERAESLDLIEIAHGEMATEIHHTMGHDYRKQLHQCRNLLEKLMRRLGNGAEPAR